MTFQLIQSYRVTGNLDSVRSSANRSIQCIVRVDISWGINKWGYSGTIDGIGTGEQG
jgi:hypothetical protein